MDTEFVNFANQIKGIKAVVQELKQIKAFTESSKSVLEESTQALNTAVKKSDNIANAICRTFMQVENTVINVKLSEEDKSILAEYCQKLIEDEKGLSEKQMAELRAIHENHWKEIQNLIKFESGFYFTGWFAKVISVSYLILYIACGIMFFLLIK